MNKQSKTVCMTVTHPRLGQAHQPLLTDACLEIVGSHPAYLYGMQGTRNLLDDRYEVSARHNVVEINRFAVMTFRIAGDPDAPLRSASGRTLQVFDFKTASQHQRDDFTELLLAVLHRNVDADLIDRAVGDTKSRDEVLRRLVLAFPVHLHEVMSATDLKILILPMTSRVGFVRAMAMIARAHVQTYVTEICTDPDGRDFAYRLEDADGVVRHLALPPKVKKMVTHETKGYRRPRTARISMTIVDDLAYLRSEDAKFDIVGLDRWCAQAIGSDIDWVSGFTDHPYARNPQSSDAAREGGLPKSTYYTRTLTSLVCEKQKWPDCSRHETLKTLPFFHPDYVSAANLREFIALLKDEIQQHEGVNPRIAAMVFGDPRRELDELAMCHPIHVLGVLERTSIDVAVLPKRWPDGNVTMMTIVRAHRLQLYLESICTVGTPKPVRYVMRYDSNDQGPIWIDTPESRRKRPARPRMLASVAEDADADFDDSGQFICG